MDRRSSDDESPEYQARKRKRLRNQGALAQSYPPAGLGELLHLSPEARARASAEWRARPRAQRLGLYALLLWEMIFVIATIGGAVAENRALVLTGALILIATLIATAIVVICGEARESRRRRRDRRLP